MGWVGRTSMMVLRGFSFLLLVSHCFFLIILSSQLSAQQSNLYRNKTHAFQITFPEGWIQKPGITPHTVVKAENSEGYSIVIQAWNLPEDISFENATENELLILTKVIFEDFRLKFPGAVMQNWGSTFISNQKGIWLLIKYTYRVPFSEIDIKTLLFAVPKNSKWYQILSGGPENKFNRFESDILKSVRSFLFEDPVWYR